ncbi:hypothetical protein [Nostoc sp. FACHB-888]|uniref:hypothetical protein n=1 Tax=Nostoc sp. FACHB-888 TaxID=2692842 RepID=UPI0016873815|nr:hypothetical protein [Nostoc sp. FACHB-888]MBD2246787.1 hypothetical protein [Nostoc sp. FACHB-888]
MEQKTNWQNTGLGLVGIALIGWLLITLFSTLEQAPWQALTVVLAVFGSALSVGSNFQNQIRNEQREYKVKIYEDITHFFFEIIFATKLGKIQKTEEEVTAFLVDITPKLVMWGSDDVVKSFKEFRSSASKTGSDSYTSSIETMLFFERMLLDIRKDLGHSNRNLKTCSILGIFVNDIEEFIAAAIQETQHQEQNLQLSPSHNKN